MTDDIRELEMWWDRFHGLPGSHSQVATLEEVSQLAEEADRNTPLVEPETFCWWSSGMSKTAIAILALLTVEVLLLFPKVMRLFQ